MAGANLTKKVLQVMVDEINLILTLKDEIAKLDKKLKSMRELLRVEEAVCNSEGLKKLKTQVRDLEDVGKISFSEELRKMETQTRDLEYEIDDVKVFMPGSFFKEIMVDMEFDWTKEQRSEFTNWCFRKDKFGRNPLHVAALKGRVDVIEILLEFCPKSMKEVTATRETCLHMAVIHDNTNVLQQLLKWIGERPDFFYLLNLGDYQGNTVLHLATSRKQLQTLRVLLSCELVDVNALNSGGFTALDILYVLPYSGKIDMEIDIILRQAGAMRSRDLTNQRIEHTDDNCSRWLSNSSSDVSTVKSICRCRNALLLTATLLATTTFQAGLRPSGSTSSEGYVYNSITGTIQKNKQDAITFGSFVVFNSIAFLASEAMIIFLLRGFPLKPWPQISVIALFGSYICSIMATSPNEALALFLISIPFLLLAVAGKLHGFASQSSLQH